MALTFPLVSADFMDKLPISEARFEAPTQREITGLGGGEILSAELAPPLWQGVFPLRPLPISAAAEIVALLSALEVPGRAFFAYNPDRAGPLSDSDGSVVAGYSPVISAWDSAAGTVDLGGLPDGYVISAGDMVGWSYGSSPTRYALHRFLEGATVAAGQTGALQVYPHIRGSIAANAPATLRKPACKAVVVPGSTDFGTTRGRTVYGIEFRWRQSLR